ncbi:hypothetical protein BC629DRAFT_669048, partial [Irpex lacteus]
CFRVLQTCWAITSWWGGSSPTPAPESKPFDPTDPKQNPLNPKGLKPYVGDFCAVICESTKVY